MIPGILFGTLSFMGILPLAFGYALADLLTGKNIKVWSRKVFSIENILCFCTLGSTLILYFYGNAFSSKPDDVAFKFVVYGDKIGIYLIFVIVCVLLYALCIWQDNSTNIIYYLSIAVLIILPLFKMGIFNDLVMRVSIPSLFILMTLILEHLQSGNIMSGGFIKKVCNITLLITLLIGMYYSFSELELSSETEDYTVLGNEMSLGTLEGFANRNLDNVRDDYKYNYFSYDIENNLFYKYIAKRALKQK